MSPRKKNKKSARAKDQGTSQNNQAFAVVLSRKEKEKKRDRKKEIDQLFKDLGP